MDYAEISTIQTEHQAAITRLFAGDSLPYVPIINGSYAGYYGTADNTAFDQWLAADLPDNLPALLHDAADPITFHPLVVEFAPFGVHYIDALFGARVFQHEGQHWSDLLPGDLADLSLVDVAASPLGVWTLNALDRLLAHLPLPVAATFPIFSSPLNVAINLFGEEVLMDLADPDDGVLHGLAVIGATISDLHQLMRQRYPADRLRFYCSCTRWAPDGFGHICGCSTQLLGAEAYARYLASLDARILATYPHGGTIHLCGRHTQHLACWRAMPTLRGVQLNDAAADDFPAYFAGLRDDQLIYIAPTEAMPIERILAASKGRRIILQAQCSERCLA